MLNYGNLSDVDFEYLCLDIMEKKLETKLRRFAAGADGGIDLTDNPAKPKIVVQVKHYSNSTVAQLKASLKKEIPKVEKIHPEQYYVCCCKPLSPDVTREIYEMFADYMESVNNIQTILEIDEFLQNKENADILEKHYKLWVESTGVLQNLYNRDVFVDSEVLMSDVGEDMKVFVQTTAFDKAKALLEDNRILFIIGNPGVGKSMTSKMLVLHFAANGYRVRFTSNTSDFASLKRSLSEDKEKREIILVDDCFGQAYFDLRSEQNSDLLSLIKYVSISKNKLLLLNSRVTIFQEAKNRGRELASAIDSNRYGVYVLDMSAIRNIEKARILYNHLFAHEIDPAYFSEIQKDHRYRHIISHPNYNPRIIEYVCNPRKYRQIEPKRYYPFIIDNLQNPREVWRDEYEQRLEPVDRILLLTVFSLSDGLIEEDLAQRCCNYWIINVPGVDKTVNQYEASLNRLLDGFLHIVDNHGERLIGVVNPSVNDYLRSELAQNSGERNYLLENACSIHQYVRLYEKRKLIEFLLGRLKKKTLNTVVFDNDNQRRAIVAWLISESGEMIGDYRKDIREYLLDPSRLQLSKDICVAVSVVLEKLICRQMIDFYELEHVYDIEDVSRVLEYEEAEEVIAIVCAISPLFRGTMRPLFSECAADAIQAAIQDYCDHVDLLDYDPDVSGALNQSIIGGEHYESIDEKRAEDLVVEEVQERVDNYLSGLIERLPSDIKEARDYLEQAVIDSSGAAELVNSYMMDNGADYDDYEERRTDNESEIDYIFNRN